MAYLLRVLMVMGACAVFAGCGGGDGGTDVDCKGDAVCEGCLDDPRPPWCYSDAAGEQDDPDMCENISTYWGEAAATVEAYCIYEIAKKNKDCSLCSRITNSQVHAICVDDCQ